MNFLSVVKRVAPFVLTLTIGLLVASFFVTVAAPNFQFKRGGFKRHRDYDRQRDARINELERENKCLKNRLSEVERRDWVLDRDLDVPPPPPPPSVMPMKTVPQRAR